MAYIYVHEEDCLGLLGNKYTDVHEWLDEYAEIYPPSSYYEYHRGFRHNQSGIDKLNGFYKKMAGKIHIIRDYEVYVLQKPFYSVELEEIDKLFDKVLPYLDYREDII